MANGNINLVNLDFDTLKTSFKEYLQSQEKFADYDFDGSNISVLLDVMTYNTYLNSFYLNMVASEMFLDSAQLRESVISHAKELNYVPRSFRSSRAYVNLRITPANSSITSVTVPRGTTLTSKLGSNTFSYTIHDTIVINEFSNGTFYANNVEIFEGSLFTDTFVYNSSAESQRFVLSNPTIDTTTMRVYVSEDNTANVTQYQQANSYIGLVGSSKVFFVQAAERDLYEMTFGNGSQGQRPKDGSIVSVVYQVCNGELPNGAALFTIDDAIDGHSNVAVTTVSISSGGAIHETTQSIKKNAPRYYQTQERAVSSSDYKTLLQLSFPEIQAVNVYGGENDDPPRYGKVVISVDVRDEESLSENKQTLYKEFLKLRSPLTIDPVFTPSEYLNLMITSDVKYDVNQTTSSQQDIISAVKTKVRVFNELYLSDFNTTFRYSQLTKDIDSVGLGILSNDTEVLAYKEVRHTLLSNNPFTVKFRQALQRLTPRIGTQDYVSLHTLTTSAFTIIDTSGATIRAEIEDDGYGILNVVSSVDDTHQIILGNVGTINYTTGVVSISKLNILSYEGTGIRFYARIDSSDITSSLNDVIRIKDSDIIVTATGQRT